MQLLTALQVKHCAHKKKFKGKYVHVHVRLCVTGDAMLGRETQTD